MRHRYLLLLTVLLGALPTLAKRPAKPHVAEPLVYTGICGGSAAAAAGGDLFVVADDEANQLRVYHRDQGGPPLQVMDLTADLELDRRAPETDIEGAARIGDKVYWISSHSRNHLGKEHPNRYRFFATTLTGTNEHLQLSFVGRPYKDLLRDLIGSRELRGLNLGAAAQLPPKAPGGLNIEGLCATPDGQLLIGFRNPVPGGTALLVPLRNPAEVIAGKPADFGRPMELDLNGLGIRDIGFWQGTYLIVAGPSDGGRSRLYSWSGQGAKPKHLKDLDLKGLNPEAIIIYPDLGLQQIQLLSDDSSRQAGVSCKDLRPAIRQFRSVWVRTGLDPRRAR